MNENLLLTVLEYHYQIRESILCPKPTTVNLLASIERIHEIKNKNFFESRAHRVEFDSY